MDKDLGEFWNSSEELGLRDIDGWACWLYSCAVCGALVGQGAAVQLHEEYHTARGEAPPE